MPEGKLYLWKTCSLERSHIPPPRVGLDTWQGVVRPPPVYRALLKGSWQGKLPAGTSRQPRMGRGAAGLYFPHAGVDGVAGGHLRAPPHGQGHRAHDLAGGGGLWHRPGGPGNCFIFWAECLQRKSFGGQSEKKETRVLSSAWRSSSIILKI